MKQTTSVILSSHYPQSVISGHRSSGSNKGLPKETFGRSKNGIFHRLDAVLMPKQHFNNKP